MLFENHGVLIGSLLLCAVTACCVLLGRKAARSIDCFRDEHHERFRGRERV